MKALSWKNKKHPGIAAPVALELMLPIVNEICSHARDARCPIPMHTTCQDTLGKRVKIQSPSVGHAPCSGRINTEAKQLPNISES